jgi:hypothetical protein
MAATAPGERRGAAAGSAIVSSRALAEDGAADAEGRVFGKGHAPANKARLLEILGRVDWEKALRDLRASGKAAHAKGRRGPVDPDALVESAQIKLALAEAARELGLRRPTAALSDPTVRSVVLPAWLNALDVGLDAGQADAIRRLVSQPTTGAVAATTFLAARQSTLRSRVELEQQLAQVLTREQLETYATNVRDDPLMRPSVPPVRIAAATSPALAQQVAAYWTRVFRLGASAQEPTGLVATQYVAAVLAVPPVAPNLDAPTARIETLNRTTRLVDLQQQAEKTLAACSSLTPEESARVRQGSRVSFQLSLTP